MAQRAAARLPREPHSLRQGQDARSRGDLTEEVSHHTRRLLCATQFKRQVEIGGGDPEIEGIIAWMRAQKVFAQFAHGRDP